MPEYHIHIHDHGTGAPAKVKTSRRGGQKAATRKGATGTTKKRSGKKNPKLGRAMRQAHKSAKKKNGEFKKGWDRSRMLKHAHNLKKRM